METRIGAPAGLGQLINKNHMGASEESKTRACK